MVLFCKKTAYFILSIIILAVIAAPTAYAAAAEETVIGFSDGGSNIICVAHRGDWHSFPENSAEAVNAALTCDAVSVDVKITADGVPVLMADDSVDRMCADKDGNPVSGAVSSFTLRQLKEFYLREADGGTKNPITKATVPELKEIFELTDGKTALMLNVSAENFKVVYDYVKDLGKTAEAVFRIDAKIKQIIELTKDTDVTATGNYQGNIIFLATSAAKKAFNNDIYTMEMGSKNGHGVLYDSFLMKRFSDRKRAMVSMVNGRCGGRPDNETGWDDLISRGYSVIETDYPTELTEYLRRASAAAVELEKLVDLYGDEDLSPYTTESEKAFSSALTASKQLLRSPSSFSELTDARYSLQSAYDSLTVGATKKVALQFKFTPGRIITVVLCAAAFTVGSLYLYNRKNVLNGGNI